MEKKNILVYVLTIILTIALGVGIGFGVSKLSQNNNEQEVKYNNNQEVINEEETDIENNEIDEKKENNCENNADSVIPTSDLITLTYEASEDRFSIFYAYIENGFLYYYLDNKESDGRNVANDGITETAFDFISYFGANTEGKTDIKKYEGLDNIKRIKSFNIGTGVDHQPFVITESGDVYSLRYNSGVLQLVLVQQFKGYQVENILSHSGEEYDEFEILLKDGTKETIK